MRPVERRRRAVPFALGAGMLWAVLLSGSPSAANWQDTASPATAMALTSATLAPPTSPSASLGTCVLLVGDAIVVSWTHSTSAFRDGYDVLRSTTNGGPYSVVAHVGANTTAYTDNSVSFSRTYYYRVRTTKARWTSTNSAQVSRTTRSSLCIL